MSVSYWPIYCDDCGDELPPKELTATDPRDLCKDCAPEYEAGRKTF